MRATASRITALWATTAASSPQQKGTVVGHQHSRYGGIVYRLEGSHDSVAGVEANPTGVGFGVSIYNLLEFAESTCLK
jgi:hypothetical protein